MAIRLTNKMKVVSRLLLNIFASLSNLGRWLFFDTEGVAADSLRVRAFAPACEVDAHPWNLLHATGRD